MRRHLAVEPLDDVGRVVNDLAVPFEHRHPRPRALGHREQVGLVLVMAIDRMPLELLVGEHAPHLLGERRDWILVEIYFTHFFHWRRVRREPFNLQREHHIVADQIPNMASALRDFDQSMKLIVAGAGFNLKFYFNFFHMPFFVGPRTYRRRAQARLCARAQPLGATSADIHRARRGTTTLDPAPRHLRQTAAIAARRTSLRR